MFNLKILKTFIFCMLFLPAMASGSGGWIANGTALVAYMPHPKYSTVSSDSDRQTESKTWNSLLLPKGESQLRVGFAVPKVGSRGFSVMFGFDHSFTEKLMTSNFLYWSYSLLAGNGIGSELALHFGISSFFDTPEDGLYVTPGLGLSYSYTDTDWRLVADLSVVDRYYLRSAKWNIGFGLLNLRSSYFLSEKWSTGLSVGPFVVATNNVANAESEINEAYFYRDLKANLGYEIDKKSSILLGVGVPKGELFSLDYSYRW